MSVLIVLGGPLTDDNKPGIWLKSRLDKAIKVYNEINLTRKLIYDKPYQYLFINTDTQRLFKGFDEIIVQDGEDDDDSSSSDEEIG